MFRGPRSDSDFSRHVIQGPRKGPASGILYRDLDSMAQAKQYVPVCTGLYLYTLVHPGTLIQFLYVLVRTGTYLEEDM